MIIGLSRLIDIIVSLNRRFRQAQIEKKLKQRYVSVDPFSLYKPVGGIKKPPEN